MQVGLSSASSSYPQRLQAVIVCVMFEDPKRVLNLGPNARLGFFNLCCEITPRSRRQRPPFAGRIAISDGTPVEKHD